MLPCDSDTVKFFDKNFEDGPGGVGENELRYALSISFSSIVDEYRATWCVGFVGHPVSIFIGANRWIIVIDWDLVELYQI